MSNLLFEETCGCRVYDYGCLDGQYAIIYCEKHRIKDEMKADELEQCPFFKACKCRGVEFCGGCEDLHEFMKITKKEKAELEYRLELANKHMRLLIRERDEAISKAKS